METLTVDLLANHSNCTIVKHPGRHYPGAIIQGDTLHRLHGLAKQVCAAAEFDEPDEELAAISRELADNLAGFVALYEEAMDRHGLDLPYVRK